MATGITLNRKTLTAVILLSVLIPVGYGLGLAAWMKPIPEPRLDARVRLDAIWVGPESDAANRRLIPSITVRNPTEHPWKNVTSGLNEQFYASEPKGVAPGGTLSIPLEAFVARNGSVKFPVGNRKIKHVIVFGQITTGARAVAEFDFIKHQQKGLNDKSNDKSIEPSDEIPWVSPDDL